MKEKPILFKPEMVKAILDGRKSFTRRPMKPQPTGGIHWNPVAFNGYAGWVDNKLRKPFPCKIGNIGDLLWVKETWRIESFMDGEPMDFGYKAGGTAEVHHEKSDVYNYEEWYERMCMQSSDYLEACQYPFQDDEGIYYWNMGESPLPWKSPLFIPRWASRITLKIRNVYPQRIRDITQKQSREEGIKPAIINVTPRNKTGCVQPYTMFNYRKSFKELWQDMYQEGEFDWSLNPFVWAIEFEPMEIRGSVND